MRRGSSSLPETLVVEASGSRIGLVHIPGPRAGRAERLLARFPGVDAVIYGHTDLPERTLHKGVWVLNPGSPEPSGDAAPARAMLIFKIHVGRGGHHRWSSCSNEPPRGRFGRAAAAGLARCRGSLVNAISGIFHLGVREPAVLAVGRGPRGAGRLAPDDRLTGVGEHDEVTDPPHEASAEPWAEHTVVDERRDAPHLRLPAELKREPLGHPLLAAGPRMQKEIAARARRCQRAASAPVRKMPAELGQSVFTNSVRSGSIAAMPWSGGGEQHQCPLGQRAAEQPLFQPAYQLKSISSAISGCSGPEAVTSWYPRSGR